MTTHADSHEAPALPAHDEKEPLLLPEHAGADGQAKPGGGGGKGSAKWLIFAGIALVVVTALIVAILVFTRRHAAEKTRAERGRDLAKGMKLTVAKVEISRLDREISLPGEVRGFSQATLYGKVSGYVKNLYVDRGDRVKKGQLLAVIESPEMLDDVLTAQSNYDYTTRNAALLDFGAKSGTTTVIDRDNAMNTAEQANSNLRKAKTMYAYTQVRAPFDGVVVARYVDPGALVPAATSTTQQAQPVVDIADTDMVRIFVYLGQDTAGLAKVGDSVAIYEDERPGQRIPAAVTRLAGALDPRTRTMECEIDVDNRSWHLIPGVFVHVRMAVKIPPSPSIPDDAIVTRDGTPHVAIIDDGNHVHYRAVEVGNNDGRTSRVQSGLSGGERIGINVPVEIAENDLVQPLEAESQSKGNEAGGDKKAKKTSQGGDQGGTGRVLKVGDQGGGESDKSDKGAAEAPTTTPTSEAPKPPAGPGPGPVENDPEPNLAADNVADAGKKSVNRGSGSGGAH